MKLRNAGIQDAHLLYRFQGDEGMRKFAKNKKIFSIEEHLRWYENYVTTSGNCLLIIEDNHMPKGFIRMDEVEYHPNRILVSIGILKEYRKKGYARQALREAERKINDGSTLYAEVVEENTSSHALFTDAGYRLESVTKGIFSYIKRVE